MGTKHRGPPEERRALDAYVKFVRAYDTVDSRLRSALREEGLTVSQLGVLEALMHIGPMVQSELAEKLLTSPSNLTTVLDNLERDGMVRRQRSTEDRRQVEVSLTSDGRELIEDVFPSHAGRITRLFGALDPEEQEELGRLCRKLGRGAG
ncbi:MAG: MarR family transcriptional regulator [Candidatus Palauibacterales bacterium]|nr:MarR family transcriptional regulator [Candidatus Palauibacterales bacterium]